MNRHLKILTCLALVVCVTCCGEGRATGPSVSLRESLVPSAIKPVVLGTVKISGEAKGDKVKVRVTTSLGDSYSIETKVADGRFGCQFPQDFAGAPKLGPMLLYVDATDAAEFGGKDAVQHQAEATLIVSGGGDALPDLPLAFTDALTHSAAVPEIARSILLGIGILAVAYTYRQAWLNHSAA